MAGGDTQIKATTHKQQASAIYANLKALQSSIPDIVELVIWNRYEVLLRASPTTSPPQLAAQLKNWDDYVLRNLHDKTIVAVTTLRQVLQPPGIWLLFPAALSVDLLMTRLAQVLDVASYQPGANHGELLLQLRSTTACQRLYNCTISCGEYGNASLTSGDIHVDAQWN